MKLIRRRMHKHMQRKAQEIKAEVAQPFDWQLEWRQDRANKALSPEQRFAGEPWFERNKDGVFRFPVGR